MKTHDSKTSTSHSTAPQKPFFSASPDHAFFSTERTQPTPFFQPQAVSTPTIQVKPGDMSEEEVQRMPAFDSEVSTNGEVQRKQINSPQHTSTLPIQAKLTIGEPGDKYEQEADRVASQVVEQINAPAPAQSNQGQTLQRQEENKEELQAKPEITAIQRMGQPEEELQAKSNLQHGEAIGGGEASTDLTDAINTARGSGQPLNTGLQRSMGQAIGADFSEVRVHTNAQADQLNRSIQAKAFTTGQDVFFRQGAYEPGSRGGQELIAHELTHVVQQGGGMVRFTGDRQVRDIYKAYAADTVYHSGGKPTNPQGTTSQKSIDTSIIQRTVLADVNTEAMEKANEDVTFPGARQFTDEFEIYQSARRLAELYHMKLYWIRQPKPEKLNSKEALILVGHGGGGNFMNLSENDLKSYLLQWDLKQGMRVVLAGCETAQAKVIDFIKMITGTTPEVNSDLAFTSPRSEFTVGDKQSKALFNNRNSNLKGLDYSYVEKHGVPLKKLVDNINSLNYQTQLAFTLKLCQNLGQKQPSLSNKYSVSLAQQLKYKWDNAVEDLLKMKPETAIKNINNLQQYLNNIPNNEVVAEYLEQHKIIWSTAREQAKSFNDYFIASMEDSLPIKYKDYTVEAFRQGGPIPPILEIKYILEKHTRLQPPFAELVLSYLPSYQSFLSGKNEKVL
jgi:Domain of unknown function (DUF4157)